MKKFAAFPSSFCALSSYIHNGIKGGKMHIKFCKGHCSRKPRKEPLNPSVAWIDCFQSQKS